MTREELLNSEEYNKCTASIDYYNKHLTEKEEDNGQICDAFEEGWDRGCEYAKNKILELIDGNDELLGEVLRNKIEMMFKTN